KPRPPARNPMRPASSRSSARSVPAFAAEFFTSSKISTCLTAPKSTSFSGFPNPECRARLLQRVRAVEGVALGGDEAGVGDDAAEFAFVGAILHAGGEHDVFFDEDAADVVGAELQTDLADFYAWGE